MWVKEIFSSIAGECNRFHQGALTTFLRLYGCNLSCSYCDSPDTQILPVDEKTGNYVGKMSIKEVLEGIAEYNNQVVCITGGEPLIQKEELVELCRDLKAMGYKIVLETNGTKDPSPYHMVDCIVMDYKFEYEDQMDLYFIRQLVQDDIIKFVFSDTEELRKAIELQKLWTQYENVKAVFAYSPIHLNEEVSREDIYRTYIDILERENTLYSVFSVQIHKLINVE